MDRAEIIRYLHATVAHHICVDVREVAEAPGYLRLITIYRGQHAGLDIRVIIEFVRAREYASFNWEPDLRYIGEYPTLDEAVADLESYLETPIGRWTNYTAAPLTPTVLDEPDPDGNRAYFEELVRKGRVSLPRQGAYQHGSDYWRHLEVYGEYRPDRLEEEENERDRLFAMDDNSGGDEQS